MVHRVFLFKRDAAQDKIFMDTLMNLTKHDDFDVRHFS